MPWRDSGQVRIQLAERSPSAEPLPQGAAVPDVPTSAVRQEQAAPPIQDRPGARSPPLRPPASRSARLPVRAGPNTRGAVTAAKGRRRKRRVQMSHQCVSGPGVPERSRRLRHGVRTLRSFARIALAIVPLLPVATTGIMPKPNFAEASEALAADVLADRQAGISSDATILAWRIHLGETSELLVDERRLDEIAREIDQVLARIRNRYPETTGVAARPRYSPATLLLTVDGDLLDAIAQRWDGASEFRLTGGCGFRRAECQAGSALASIDAVDRLCDHAFQRACKHACGTAGISGR